MNASHSNDTDAALTATERDGETDRQTGRQKHSARSLIALHGRAIRDDVVIRLRQLTDQPATEKFTILAMPAKKIR